MTTLIANSPRFKFEQASERDDADLRALLRRNPMGERIRLTFEREPSFFAGALLQGEVQVGVARDRGEVIGMGTRAVSEAFINGALSPLGYLSDLRLEAPYRGGALVARGYRMLREWHRDGRTRLYFTVIFADNDTALRTIAQSRAGLPRYHDLGLIQCPGINLRRKQAPIDCGCEITRGSDALLPQIVDCLNRNNRRKQFAPLQRAEFFGGRWTGFCASDFYVALRDGRVVGVIGKWDQRAFKQTRVAGYRGALRWLAPLATAAHRAVGTPRFPKPGECVPLFYASFIAIDGDAIQVFRALLRRIYNDAVGGEFLYFLAGLHERDPLTAALDDYSLTPFAGRLFAVCFDEDVTELRSLDDRVPHVEIATL